MQGNITSESTENTNAFASSPHEPPVDAHGTVVNPPEILPADDLIRVTVGPWLSQSLWKSKGAHPSLLPLYSNLRTLVGLRSGIKDFTKSFDYVVVNSVESFMNFRLSIR